MSDKILKESSRILRANTAGELQFDEHLRPIKLVLAPDGRLIAPVMVAMIEAADTVLFLPHADDDSLQLQVTIEPFDEHDPGMGAITDRWRIYHGEPDDVTWAVLYIDAAKYGGAVIDGEALTEPNVLAATATSLLKTINTERAEALRAAVKRELALDLERPVLVGIDPYGVDVRGPFDVVRIEFGERARCLDDARKRLLEILDGEES